MKIFQSEDSIIKVGIHPSNSLNIIYHYLLPSKPSAKHILAIPQAGVILHRALFENSSKEFKTQSPYFLKLS